MAACALASNSGSIIDANCVSCASTLAGFNEDTSSMVHSNSSWVEHICGVAGRWNSDGLSYKIKFSNQYWCKRKTKNKLFSMIIHVYHKWHSQCANPTKYICFFVWNTKLNKNSSFSQLKQQSYLSITGKCNRSWMLTSNGLIILRNLDGGVGVFTIGIELNMPLRGFRIEFGVWNSFVMVVPTTLDDVTIIVFEQCIFVESIASRFTFPTFGIIFHWTLSSAQVIHVNCQNAKHANEFMCFKSRKRIQTTTKMITNTHKKRITQIFFFANKN